MATTHHNLSQFDQPIPSAEGMVIGIVVADWNQEITGALYQGALKSLLDAGCNQHDIVTKRVPGTFELPMAAQMLTLQRDFDAIIVLGCVIQGETKHFDYVCSGVTQGVMSVQLDTETPIAFGVLTVDNMQQALDRAGGKYGNKGDEAAVTAIQMAHLQREIIAENTIEIDFDHPEFS